MRDVPHAQLLHFYLAVIRPIPEYAAPVWHHLLSKCQTDQIEAVQKRALNIIFTCTYGMPCSSAVFLAALTTLTEYREQLACNFFDCTVQQRSCIHHLLPPPRHPALLSRLRAPSKFPRIPNSTKKYQFFISHSIA